MKAKTLTVKLKIKRPQFAKNKYSVKAGKTLNTKTKNVEGEVTYRIENETIATVDASGIITGVSAGETKLIMTVGGIDYETKLLVK